MDTSPNYSVEFVSTITKLPHRHAVLGQALEVLLDCFTKVSGQLDEGLPVFWTWDDMKMQAEIRPITIEVDRFISWWSSTGGDETLEQTT